LPPRREGTKRWGYPGGHGGIRLSQEGREGVPSGALSKRGKSADNTPPRRNSGRNHTVGRGVLGDREDVVHQEKAKELIIREGMGTR